MAAVEGGFEGACYAFREFLIQHGCRSPAGYNPPVHWNKLDDKPEWSLGAPGPRPVSRFTRKVLYTKSLLMEVATKARDYGCEALHLDPGWDTDSATFLQGKVCLGDRKGFISELREEYGSGPL